MVDFCQFENNKKSFISCALRTRGVATGITGAVNYFGQFIALKTYLDLESSFSLPGVSIFYGVICVIGLIVAYLIMPETERRTLEDIEFHFSDNNRSLFDRRIRTGVVGKNIIMNGNDNDIDYERKNLESNSDKSSPVTTNSIWTTYSEQ